MSKSRAKGTRWESEIVRFLHELGHPAVERKALHGSRDEGDLAGLDPWSVECKAERVLRLADYLKEIRVEMRNARNPFGAVVIKQRGKSPADAYVLIPIEVLSQLLPRRPLATSQPAITPHIPAQEEPTNGASGAGIRRGPGQ